MGVAGCPGIPGRIKSESVAGCYRNRWPDRPGIRMQRPPAGMVICGAGPNLNSELAGSKCQTGFPIPDRFDHAPIQVVDFSHLLASPGYPRQFPFTPPLPELGLDNLPASSAWPILSEPSCSPVRSPPACAASSRASAKVTILVLAGFVGTRIFLGQGPSVTWCA